MMENNLFIFPRNLKNDIEGFVFYYKIKFPEVVNEYLNILKKYHNDPMGLREVCIKESREMIKISKKFVDFYKDLEKLKDVKDLIEIDQKLNKLSCFKFWIYNYLLCEGPLQNFHVEKIKDMAEKIAERDSVEEREYETDKIEKTLLQTDYTDFYVANLLRGVRISEKLGNFPEFREYIAQFENVKDLDYKKANELSRKISEKVVGDKNKYITLWKELKELFGVCNIQKSYFPISSVIRTGFEHKEKALRYQENYEKLKNDIENIFDLARKNLKFEEYIQLEKSYKMLRLLAECKDLFGESDTITLPFWFRLIRLIADKLGNESLALGQGSSYYSFVWHVPDEIKGIIYKIDNTPFNEKELFYN